MFYVNDQYYDASFIASCHRQFKQHALLNDAKGLRLTVRVDNSELWLALCLYAQQHDISLFPLPADTPIAAARRRAERSGSHYLLCGGESVLELLNSFESVARDQNKRERDTNAVLVQMSSGTTGEPKYIERTWKSIDTELDSYVKHFSDADSMTPVVACPLSHSYGLICGALAAFKRGREPHLIANLNPKYILRKLRSVEQGILYSSPVLISTLAMMLSEDQPLYAVMSSGTLMHTQCFDRVKNKVRFFYQQYGCSEVGCIALGTGLHSPNDVGKVLPHLSVSAGTDVSQAAEIVVKRGDGSEVLSRDLGYFDKRGHLFFLSRIDDMINVSGLNVYPAEVEEVVLAMPEISDAAVFKRAHSFANEQVCLQYQSKVHLDDEKIRTWCREKLAAYQVPMHIQRVDKIERMANGKLSRKKLSEALL
ncbi:AMP-binding protein [Agaribacterium haliotis]|uniref:AMP-binding protein n=1 Tax=Agaribacterium haliotis TaxID=2013869 RepID=UPI000BB54A00|nr:AMP-binding protein [Agaribacterium haliotis]